MSGGPQRRLLAIRLRLQTSMTIFSSASKQTAASMPTIRYASRGAVIDAVQSESLSLRH